MATAAFKGDPVTLTGTELKVGDEAPDFTLQGQDLSDVTWEDFPTKTVIVLAVPSLDTSVCALEAKRFNEEVAEDERVECLVVSMDLPFAAKRFCGAENAENIHTASDHRDASFGKAYGCLIEGGPLDRILTRAVFVAGPAGTLKHVEYCSEISEHPDYEAALKAARA